MENPQSWGRAERVVNAVLDNIEANRARPPDERRFGPSRARQITDALRREGLLVEETGVEEQPSITCPRCGMTSYNPNDIREKYCGNCHDWTGR